MALCSLFMKYLTTVILLHVHSRAPAILKAVLRCMSMQNDIADSLQGEDVARVVISNGM